MSVLEVLETLQLAGSTGFLVGLAIAVVAGIAASAVCPCTLPIGLGVTSVVASNETESQRGGLWVGFSIFAGIVVNLTLLGALAARLGAVLTTSFGRYWALGMTTFSLLAAALAFWGPRLRVSKLDELRRPGALGAFVYGFIFSLGTSAAPLLMLLTVSAAQANPIHGALLAFAFGIGRGLPFLVVSLFAGSLVRMTRLGSCHRGLRIASGIALLSVSAYFFNTFRALI